MTSYTIYNIQEEEKQYRLSYNKNPTIIIIFKNHC